MMRFFRKLFSLPFRKVVKNARKYKLRPEKNRKHVGKSLFFLAIAVFTIFIFRFVWLITTNQVAGYNLREMAKSNYQSTVTVYAKRGTIYDRNGVAIAVDSSTYTIYVVLDKTQVDANGNKLYASPEEFDRLTTFLNSKLGIDKDLISTQLHSKEKQVEFGVKGNGIKLQQMQTLQKEADDERLVGIGFLPQLSRSYPNGNFASQFIGIASLVNDGKNQVLQGTNGGIEQSFNSILGGSNGEETYQKDNLGRPMPGTTKIIRPVKNGDNIYTTLDAQLQTTLEKLMDQAVIQSGGEQLSATLVDAHTGEILATSQRPTYTPSTVNTTAPQQKNFTWNSLLFQSAYEPGSVMKTFLMSGALTSNKVDLNATYQRKLDVYDTTINDWDVTENHAYTLPEVVNFAQGFMMSSNIGMSKVEMQMGNSLWDSYLKRFKFGVPARIGMIGEQFGNLPAANAVSQIQSAFGQGIAVTQLQLLRGWTAVAGNGTMLEPHIISKLVNTNNDTILQSKPEVVGKPVSASATAQVRNLMLGVNTDPEFGTSYSIQGDPDENLPAGPLFMVNGQAAAVKTGTAQIAAPTGGYMTGSQDYLYSAVVMYPAKNPDYIFYMNVKIPSEPWTLKYIARVANPILTQAEALKSQINATTATTDKTGKVTLDNYVGKAPGDASDSLRRTVLEPVVIGQGAKVTAQSIKAGTKIGANTRVLLLTAGQEVMPDMYDWTKNEVNTLAKWYGLKVTYEGSGNHVTNQSITASDGIKKGQSVTVTLGS
ncbi:penicillin-binding transpeptidase domain-containing protein [Lactococcus nasutitermitis]|uniref:Penicillin-binding transpeptidase domain-containing protein n=1 Tax=Lactococcus nasutitermitis TaxID=1652957 RepID=A0ABV9JBZ0_9LACT|nr:penicillin-binding transpeptidase domain-containing protein [Lactococcus nasutitermitis]